MSEREGPTAGSDPSHEARRLRTAWRAVAIGAVVGVLAAAAVAVSGGGGALGLVTVLLVWALTAVGVGLYVLVVGLVDDVRRRPVTRRRPIVALGLLVTGFVLLVMAFGAAS